MTVETDIEAAVASLVGARCFPDFAPPGAAAPYAVYQQVGGESVTFLERAQPSKKNGRFQITVWALTRIQAAAINLQIEAAMVAATAFNATPFGAPIADYDETTRLRGARQDFEVWSDR